MIVRHKSQTSLHLLNPVTLSADIPFHYNLIKHQRNLPPLSSPINSPYVCNHNYLLRIHPWNFYWLLLLLPVLSPMPFPVLVPQIYFSILIHMYYPVFRVQDPISCFILFQKLSFLPQNFHQCDFFKNLSEDTSSVPPFTPNFEPILNHF